MDLRILYQGFTMFTIILQFHFLAASSIFDDDDDEVGWGRCPPIRNRLRNGRVKMRSRGRIAKFVCDPGYDLAGRRFATCVRGEWNNPLPFCVARGCPRVPTPANSQVTEMYRGSFLTYSCYPGYGLIGVASLYCDGRRWSGSPPTCQPSNESPKMECDFEEADLCGWSQDPTHALDWERTNHATPSGHMGTGPSFDHTFGEGAAGCYLYHEASSPAKVNDSSRIFSPVYPSSLSGGCFTFWYHMYGSGIGSLRLYIKAESEVFDELSPPWELNGDQGNYWYPGKISVPKFKENFQIIIEAIRGTSYEGDTAIDDLSLSETECGGVESTDATSTLAFIGTPETQPIDDYLATTTMPSTMVASEGAEDTNTLFSTDETPESESFNVSLITESTNSTITLPYDLTSTGSSTMSYTGSTIYTYMYPLSYLSTMSSSGMNTATSSSSTSQSTIITSMKEDITPKVEYGSTTTFSTSLQTSKSPTTVVTSPATSEPPSTFVSKLTSVSEDTKSTLSPYFSSIPNLTTISTGEKNPSTSQVSLGYELDKTSNHEQTTTFSSSSTETTRRTYNLRPRTKKTTVEETSYQTTPIYIPISITIPSLSTLPETEKNFHESTNLPISSFQSTSTVKQLPPLFSSTYTSSATSFSIFTKTQMPTSIPPEIQSSPLTTKRTEFFIPSHSTNPTESAEIITLLTRHFTQIIPQTPPHPRPVFPKPTLITTDYNNIDKKSASTASNASSTSLTAAVICIVVFTTAGIVGGLLYFRKLRYRKRRSKLSDDSEMRFLAENEIMDYSNTAILDKILEQ